MARSPESGRVPGAPAHGHGEGGYQALGRGGRRRACARTWRGGGQRKSPCEIRSGTVSAVPEDTGGELSRRSVRSSQGHTPGAPGPLILTPERGEGKGRCGPEAGAARCPGGAPEACPSWPKAAPGPAGARPARRPSGARRPPGARGARAFRNRPGRVSLAPGGAPAPGGLRRERQLPGDAQGRRPFGGPPGAPGVHRRRPRAPAWDLGRCGARPGREGDPARPPGAAGWGAGVVRAPPPGRDGRGPGRVERFL